MADFNALEALINAYIKQNGVKAITGQVLNGVLRGMVSALGKGWTVAGEAEPNTDPGTMTGPVAYIAHTAGTYTNFGGLVVNDGEVAFLKYNEQVWTKEVLASLQATATVDENVGIPSVDTQFVNGVLTFAFHNVKGNPGQDGTDGQDGAAAGFGTVAATVDNTVGTPAVSVTESGPNTAKNFSFAFTGLKGETGVTSVVVTVDNTSGTPQCTASLNAGVLTLAFTGLKGAQGNPGSSVDYPFTLVNNLTTNDPDQALTAAMGYQLEGEITQLEHDVTGLIDGKTIPTYTLVSGKYINTSGSVATGANYSYTSDIPVKKGQTVFVRTAGYGLCVIAKHSGSTYTPLLNVPTGDANVAVTYSYLMQEDCNIVASMKTSVAGYGVAISWKYADEADGFIVFRDAMVSNFLTNKKNVLSTPFSITNIAGVNLSAGDKLTFRVDTEEYTRFIINYNGNTGLRLIDTTADIRGKWITVVASTTITQIGLYIEGLTVGDEVKFACQYGEFFLPDGAVGVGKIADNAVSFSNLGDSVTEKLLPAFRTANLYDEREKIDGKYINNSGSIASASGWAMSPLIPVTVGEKYTLSCGSSARNAGFNWYDATGTRLSSDGSIWGTHTAPTNAAYMQFNVAASGSESTDIMVVHGATALPFVPYIQTKPVYIEGFADAVSDAANGGGLTVSKNGNTLSVSNANGTITAKLENNSGSEYSGNPVFNFTGFSFSTLSNSGADDIAPMHILNTTIGANHGQPCKKATITGHGLDNTAIGTGWTKDGVTFYVMRIVDENNIVFLSENGGTLASPSFTALTTGTIENGGNTLTVSAVADSQLVPALKNHSVKLMLNGNREITTDGIYSSKTLDVVEEYDIMNPVSTLQKIIARAGESSAPEYDGDTAVRVKNIYRFDETLSVLVIVTAMPMQEVQLSDMMFAQAALIKSGSKYYIPNSLPLGNGNYDFRKPLLVSWSSSVPALNVTESQMKDTDNPVNRVIQYSESYGVGFALGYLRGFGIGKDLLSYTGTTFEIRNNTGKIYPHGVTSAKVGNTIDGDNIYQAVMYRSPFLFSSLASGRMSMYHFAFDGAEYVFVDYASSVLDNVKVDASLNGKTVEVIEAVNTDLVTDIYNDGFLINATYVEGETCYIVAKVK